jgi:hypothetical protein
MKLKFEELITGQIYTYLHDSVDLYIFKKAENVSPCDALVFYKDGLIKFYYRGAYFNSTHDSIGFDCATEEQELRLNACIKKGDYVDFKEVTVSEFTISEILDKLQINNKV